MVSNSFASMKDKKSCSIVLIENKKKKEYLFIITLKLLLRITGEIKHSVGMYLTCYTYIVKPFERLIQKITESVLTYTKKSRSKKKNINNKSKVQHFKKTNKSSSM